MEERGRGFDLERVERERVCGEWSERGIRKACSERDGEERKGRRGKGGEKYMKNEMEGWEGG